VLKSLLVKLNHIEEKFRPGYSPKVLIINSEGPVFSSGHDLKELISSNEEKRLEIFKLCSEVNVKIQNLSPVVIAEIQGIAAAAGCQIAASCDLVVASSKSSFSTPGIKVGLFCTTPSVSVGRVISRKRATQMLVTGEQISGATALNWGLINELVDVENIESLEDQKKKNLEKAH